MLPLWRGASFGIPGALGRSRPTESGSAGTSLVRPVSPWQPDLASGSVVVRMPPLLRISALLCAVAVAAGTAVASVFNPVFIPAGQGFRFVWLTAYFFHAQDAPWLLAIAVLLGGLVVLRFRASAPPGLSLILRHPRIAVVVLSGFVLLCGIAGTDLVLDRYDFSRDEIQADFDATIFRAGMAVAPVDPEWQPFARALQPTFMRPVPEGRGFVSNYLPVSAGFRAAIGLLGDSAWTNPLLAALAVLAVFGVARRLWPDRPDAALISALLLATSSQVLVTAMTSYAMTAHLALNLLWLWLFLRNDRLGDSAAIGVGFLACGLHQIIFHPLFAAPFIMGSGSWRRRFAYLGSYAVIGLFWIFYPKLALEWQGLAAGSGTGNVGPPQFVAQLTALLTSFGWDGIGLMLKNMLRLVAWQNPILLPLALLAYWSIRGNRGIARPLAAGIVLTLIAMFVLMPYQGHGWGYRYLHGLIGNLVLLAAYGWLSLSSRARPEETGTSWRVAAVSSGIAILVLLPAHAIQAHHFSMSYARASAAIEQAPTDLVFVDDRELVFGRDLVRNDPFLRNRPKVLSLTLLTETDILHLCSRYSISIFGRSQGDAVGILPTDRLVKVDVPGNQRLRMTMASHSCGTEMHIESRSAAGLH